MHQTFWKQDLIWNKKTKEPKAAKPKVKKAPDPEDKAWKEFSLFIRTRDALRTIGDPRVGRCVTCKNIIPVKGNDAGHYVTRGNKAIKYHTQNVHLQCSKCNRFLSGNVLEYRKVMLEMYGEEFVSYLENVNDIVKTFVDWEEETVKWRKMRKALVKGHKDGKFGANQIEVKKTFANSCKLDTILEVLKRATDNSTT